MKDKVLIYFLILIGLWYVGCMIFRKNHYMNCKKMVTEHLKFLRKEDGNWKKIEFLNFFLVPLVIAIVLVLYNIQIDAKMAETILVIMSILLSTFFMIITVVLSFKNPVDADRTYSAMEYDNIKNLIGAVTNAIIFEIFISIIIVLLSFLIVFTKQVSIIQSICSFLSFYLILVMVLNLFIVLRSFSALVRVFIK